MCLYLVTPLLDPTGVGRARWTMRWKPALNAFAINLRRPIPGRRNLLMETAGNTVNEIVPGTRAWCRPRILMVASLDGNEC
jgi:hypothetical protein